MLKKKCTCSTNQAKLYKATLEQVTKSFLGHRRTSSSCVGDIFYPEVLVLTHACMPPVSYSSCGRKDDKNK